MTENESIVNNNQTADISINPPIALPERPISNFWIRIFAFIFDGIIIVIFGQILGLLFKNYFAQMGQSGKLVGLCVELLYFGILNSSIAKGQTIGKKLFKIRVVDKNGNHISILRSFIRIFILIVPYYLNGITLPKLSSDPVVGYAISLIITLVLFGGGFGIIYLYIFNKKTRQSLHDVICRTCVVKANTTGSILVGPIWRLHYIVLGIIFSFIIIVNFFIISIVRNTYSKFEILNNIEDRISKINNVSSGQIITGEIRNRFGRKKYINVYIKYRIRPGDFELAANQAAEILKSADSLISFSDYSVSIIIEYGYDIGIASSYERHFKILNQNE